MGPIQFIVQCHWDYTDSNCPVSPSDPVYDWECDPRSQTCADDQYQMAEMSVAKMSNDFVQIEEVEEEEEEEEEQEEEPEYESEEHSEDYDQEPTKIKNFENVFSMNNESDTSSFASTFQRETTMSEIDPNALNQNTPVIQNFIDFRPVFDGFHKMNEENLDRSARQITEVDNRVIIELKEINDKVMDKNSKLEYERAQLQVRNNNLIQKLSILSKYLRSKITERDGSAMFQEMMDA